MNTYLLTKIQELLGTHPKVVFLIILCCLTTGYTVWSLAGENFAGKQELVDLKVQISAVDQKVEAVNTSLEAMRRQATIDSLVQQIATKDSEVFALQGLVDSDEANVRDRERLANLMSEVSNLNKLLDAIYKNQ